MRYLQVLVTVLLLAVAACGSSPPASPAAPAAPAETSSVTTPATPTESATSAAPADGAKPECVAATDCKGMTPKNCMTCPAGSTGNGCAHWACKAGKCTIATCD